MLDVVKWRRVRRGLRLVLYALLVVTAVTTFFLGEALWTAVRASTLPEWAPLIPPVFFSAFVLLYIVERWFLVRRQNFSSGRAVFQVAFSLVFLAFMWSLQADDIRSVRRLRPNDPALQLLHDRREAYRMAGCELLGLRGQLDAYGALEFTVEQDQSEQVRKACRKSLQRLMALNQGTRAP